MAKSYAYLCHSHSDSWLLAAIIAAKLQSALPPDLGKWPEAARSGTDSGQAGAHGAAMQT